MEKLVTPEARLKDVEEENKFLTAKVKSLLAGARPANSHPELAKIKPIPTDSELDEQVMQTKERVRT